MVFTVGHRSGNPRQLLRKTDRQAGRPDPDYGAAETASRTDDRSRAGSRCRSGQQRPAPRRVFFGESCANVETFSPHLPGAKRPGDHAIGPVDEVRELTVAIRSPKPHSRTKRAVSGSQTYPIGNELQPREPPETIDRGGRKRAKTGCQRSHPHGISPSWPRLLRRQRTSPREEGPAVGGGTSRREETTKNSCRNENVCGQLFLYLIASGTTPEGNDRECHRHPL